jgi:hypothetical protein
MMVSNLREINPVRGADSGAVPGNIAAVIRDSFKTRQYRDLNTLPLTPNISIKPDGVNGSVTN